MNKYLEKIASFEKQALNAQTAREMAKKVGVIADPESNWKYALRNLRDGRGNPLEGKAKREGWNRLAGGRDIIREHQAMSAMQRKLRDVDEIQYISKGTNTLMPPSAVHGAGHLSLASKELDPLAAPAEGRVGNIVGGHAWFGNPHQLSVSHVHPNINSTNPTLSGIRKDIAWDKSSAEWYGKDPRSVTDEVSRRLGTTLKNRLSMPSGSDEQQRAFRHMGKVDRRRAFTDDPLLGDMVDAQMHGDEVAFGQAANKFVDKDSLHKYQARGARQSPTTGDSSLFGITYANKVNPIHDPTNHTIGLHKVTTGGLDAPHPVSRRSVYLDVTPRSMK